MSETKNDTRARAKREIAEEWQQYLEQHPACGMGSHYYDELKGEWAEELAIAERVKNLELRERVKDLLPRVAQLLDGWHNDGTAWSEWDESVRKEVSEMLAGLERKS